MPKALDPPHSSWHHTHSQDVVGTNSHVRLSELLRFLDDSNSLHTIFLFRFFALLSQPFGLIPRYSTLSEIPIPSFSQYPHNFDYKYWFDKTSFLLPSCPPPGNVSLNFVCACTPPSALLPELIDSYPKHGASCHPQKTLHASKAGKASALH